VNVAARPALQDFQQPDWWEACRERAAGLPPAMAALAAPVIDGHDPAGWEQAVHNLRAGARRFELAAFAPQWAGHVEALIGWPGLASGAWWMHAHTKDVNWKADRDLREASEEEVTERTPLTASDLVDGAVDVWWFTDACGRLGQDRWKALDAAAKYCSTGTGHRRAQLFADAVRGQASEAELRHAITEKRHQDSVRALGLLPLPAGAARDQAAAQRYGLIQEFRRTSRQFGPARRASEQRAADIALANLARMAGYRDPLRLSWAMEARGIADPEAKELRRQAASCASSPRIRCSRPGSAGWWWKAAGWPGTRPVTSAFCSALTAPACRAGPRGAAHRAPGRPARAVQTALPRDVPAVGRRLGRHGVTPLCGQGTRTPPRAGAAGQPRLGLPPGPGCS
jgi:Family of unknown function (DUF5724)